MQYSATTGAFRVCKRDEFEGSGTWRSCGMIQGENGGRVWAEGWCEGATFTLPIESVNMNERQELDILLVEDNPNDAELTSALRKQSARVCYRTRWSGSHERVLTGLRPRVIFSICVTESMAWKSCAAFAQMNAQKKSR
jgi:hypothetical protein